MDKLSKRQREILNFIKQEVKEKGYPPSVREIGEAVGLSSSSTVHGHLARLESKGFIRRDPTKPRAIEILEWEPEERYRTSLYETSQLLGKLLLVYPSLPLKILEEYFPLPEKIAPEGDTVFMLEIEGDSMIDAGILDGDYVVVRQQNTALNGDIVVAMTPENEATVKRFYKEKNYVRLQPENPTMEPIILPTVSILGKVIGVYRHIY